MATYSGGTSTAGEVLHSVEPIVSAYLRNIEGDFTAMSMVGTIETMCPVTLYYDLEDGVITTGQSAGQRMANQPEPLAAGGTIETIRLEKYEWGEEVVLDTKLDQTLVGQDVDQVGAMRSAMKLRSIMERKVSELLDSSTSAWTAADVAAGTAWTTTTTNVMKQIIDLLVSFDTENTLVSHRPNAIRMSRKAALNLAANTMLVAQFGGNQGAGVLTADQLAAALRTIGIEYVFIAPTALAAGYVNVFYYSPDPRINPTGVILAHEGAIGSTSRRQIGHSRMGYYTSVVGDIGVLPNLGKRLTGAV